MRMIDIIKPVYIDEVSTEPLSDGWALLDWRRSRVGFQASDYNYWAYSLAVF